MSVTGTFNATVFAEKLHFLRTPFHGPHGRGLYCARPLAKGHRLLFSALGLLLPCKLQM